LWGREDRGGDFVSFQDEKQSSEEKKNEAQIQKKEKMERVFELEQKASPRKERDMKKKVTWVLPG